MSTHNIYFYGEISTKYPPYLFHYEIIAVSIQKFEPGDWNIQECIQKM